MNIDWTVIMIFGIVGGFAWGLFGMSSCTQGCNHDEAIMHCVTIQAEMSATSTGAIDLHCMSR